LNQVPATLNIARLAGTNKYLLVVMTVNDVRLWVHFTQAMLLHCLLHLYWNNKQPHQKLTLC